MAPREAKPKAPKPPKPWSRAEAGRYVSADERFTLESDGAGRWFATDAASLDELGLARTLGPFATLDAAKAAADEARTAPAAESPLADRLREAASRPRPSRPAARQPSPAPTAPGTSPATGPGEPAPDRPAERPSKPEREPEPAPEPAPEPEPAPPPRTWLDDLADDDPDAARRARALVEALAAAGIADADALVRRDVLGDVPAVASRLLARDLLRAVAKLKDPSAADVLAAALEVVTTPPRRRGLPGWALVERDGPPDAKAPRPVRTAREDLDAAARGD